MWQPTLRGEIERRLLVNYRVDPDAVARVLPAPFRPQLVDGAAVAGICLIRLGRLRPSIVPVEVGLRTENAAHRVAVTWQDPVDGRERRGVYITRRDTDSLLAAGLGGRLFPGRQHRARFDVTESQDRVEVAYASRDGRVKVAVRVTVTPDLTDSRLFPDLATASAFFEAGSDGFSDTDTGGRFDGMHLRADGWRVEAVRVDEVRSSFFDDPAVFGPGQAEIDNALLMRRIPVVWEPLPQLRTEGSAAPR